MGNKHPGASAPVPSQSTSTQALLTKAAEPVSAIAFREEWNKVGSHQSWSQSKKASELLKGLALPKDLLHDIDHVVEAVGLTGACAALLVADALRERPTL